MDWTCAGGVLLATTPTPQPPPPPTITGWLLTAFIIIFSLMFLFEVIGIVHSKLDLSEFRVCMCGFKNLQVFFACLFKIKPALLFALYTWDVLTDIGFILSLYEKRHVSGVSDLMYASMSVVAFSFVVSVVCFWLVKLKARIQHANFHCIVLLTDFFLHTIQKLDNPPQKNLLFWVLCMDGSIRDASFDHDNCFIISFWYRGAYECLFFRSQENKKVQSCESPRTRFLHKRIPTMFLGFLRRETAFWISYKPTVFLCLRLIGVDWLCLKWVYLSLKSVSFVDTGWLLLSSWKSVFLFVGSQKSLENAEHSPNLHSNAGTSNWGDSILDTDIHCVGSIRVLHSCGCTQGIDQFLHWTWAFVLRPLKHHTETFFLL